MTGQSKLQEHTVIVADTGNFKEQEAQGAQDATTNPTLILKAVKDKKYEIIVDQAIKEGIEIYDEKKHGDKITFILDYVTVYFGKEIQSIVPGLVSTEVDARQSFNTNETVQRARRQIELYENMGIKRERVLIKIASTWEGIQAAKILEKENISCNLTLLFSLPQAIACAEANVTLISPFVGRIYDWYCKQNNTTYNDSSTDPGVLFVKNIYEYYKKYGYKTIVMGASFRNIGEILELCGCDKLTISPILLKELQNYDGKKVIQKLFKPKDIEKPSKIAIDEARFRWEFNDDLMATYKLAEGIRLFAIDCTELETFIRLKLYQ